jgi:hypothetical protein
MALISYGGELNFFIQMKMVKSVIYLPHPRITTTIGRNLGMN